jgi:hypothetical protein
MYERIIAKSTLASGFFLGQNVTLERLLSLNLAASGDLKALLRTGLGF